MSDLQNHMENYLKRGKRYDGRKLDEYREIKVETGIANTAEGSARVQIGDTHVLVGVKMEVGKPYPDKQDEGTMMVNAELLPMSSPKYEPGPPGIDAIELARVTDRGIRESGAIDTKKLCIKEGELVWTAVIDVVPINDAGNMYDAASLGAMLALKDARFPELDGDKVNYKEHTKKKLPLVHEPVAVTVLKIGDHYMVDPIPQEEKILDARLTVAVAEDGKIVAMQKGGPLPLTSDDVEKMLDLAVKKTKELRKYLG